MTDGNSDIQSALPARKTGLFYSSLTIVLMTLSTMLSTSSVNLE